jgi:pimeloyl-ACP methyl ester carboxylesterase
MDGVRRVVRGAGGVDIGLLTCGSGPPLLLVHGGVGQIERWEPVWRGLADRWRVTAMDRRGRGSSADDRRYAIDDEFGDVAAAVSALSEDAGRPVDVFGHSYGATCALGAAGRSSSLRRLVLYEPPARETVSPEFVDLLGALVAEGRAGTAMTRFLMDIIGLTGAEVDALRSSPPSYDILSVLSATLPREARALLDVDLAVLGSRVACPSLFLVGERSPAWAHTITRATSLSVDDSRVVTLTGVGHEAIDANPDAVVAQLALFLGPPE